MFKKVKALLRKLLMAHAEPHDVAFSFAVGVLIAFSPFLGFHTLIAVGLIFILKKNEVAAIIGVWVNNPITIFPMYYAAYVTGIFVMRADAKEFNSDTLLNIFNMGKDILIPLTIGGTILGILSAIPSYFLVKKIYPIVLEKKEQWLHRLRDHHEPPSR